MIQSLPEPQLFDACRILLGPEINLSKDFLFYLQPTGVQSAYRRRARETHPDLMNRGSQAMEAERTEAFRNVSEAYEVLKAFLKQRDSGIWKPSIHTAKPPRTSTRSQHPTQPQSSAEPPHTATRARHDIHIPQQKMFFGLYLVHRGIISHQALVKGLVWQRKQRPFVGVIATRWGWLDAEKVQEILEERSLSGRFGEKAVLLNLLTPFQVKTLLRYQRNQQQRLGMFFVKQGYITRTQLIQLLRDLREHNRRVSKI
ncbi:DnaJ domain-containing protein [Desulfoplanes sp.]